MKKLFKNTFGFGLVEVLIAAGLAGGLALTIAKLSQNASRVTKTTESNNEINLMLSDVAYILSDKASCVGTIGGLPANGAAVTNIVKAGTPNVNKYVVGTKYGNGTFTISSMQTETVGSNTSLKLEITRLSNVTYGSKIITKKIPLKAIITAGNITSCYSDTDNMIANAVAASCQGNSAFLDMTTTPPTCTHEVSVVPVCPTGQAIKEIQIGGSNELVPVCMPIMTSISCAKGKYFNGFDVSGAPICSDSGSVCNDGQFVRQGPGSAFTCIDIPVCTNSVLIYKAGTPPTFVCASSTCGANQYVQGINSNGAVVCKTVPNGQCGSGQYVKEVKGDGTLVCDTVPASASGSVAANQYVGGFNSDGTLIARNYPTCPLTSYLTFDGTTFSCKSLPPVSAWSADSNGISGTNTFRNQINGNNSSYVSLEISNSAMGNSEARVQLDGGGGYQFSIGSIAYNASTSSFSGYGEPGGGYIGGANTKSIGINTHFVPYTYYTSRIPTLGLSTRRWAYIYLSNSPNVSSDRRLKRDIEKVELGLDFIEELNPVSYKLKADKKNANYDRTRFGFIAQDVSKTLSKYTKVKDTELVTMDDKGFLGMSYDALIAPIVKAIQELSDKVDSLFNQQDKAIKNLELRMNQLEKENRMLKEEIKKAPQ